MELATIEKIALEKNINVWDFIPNFDTKNSYSAFLEYLKLGLNRSLRRLSQQINKTLPTLANWSKKHLWQDRARIYDFSLEKEKLQLTRKTEIDSHVNELAKYRDNLKDLGWQNLAIAQECFDVGYQYIAKTKQNPEAIENMRSIDFKNIMSAGNQCAEQALKTLSEALAVGKLLEQLDDSIDIDSEEIIE